MNWQSSVRLLWLRRVEEADRERAILSDAERRAAAASAGIEGLPERAGEALAPEEADFLVARADRLQRILDERFPSAGDPSRWPTSPPAWAVPALVAVAFGIGLGSDALTGREINLLSPFLFGVLVWNFAIYLALAGSAIRDRLLGRKGDGGAPGALTAIVERLQARFRREPGEDALPEPLARALSTFRAEWLERARPLLAERLAMALHVGSAAWALGTIGSIYWRGMVRRYVVGWESTFFDAESLAALFRWVFGPASWLTGKAVVVTEAMDLSRPFPDQESRVAADWLHLFAVALAVYVVVPRIVLAFRSRAAWARLAASPRPPGDLRPWLDRIRKTFAGAADLADVVPYAFEPDPRCRETVRHVVRELWGGNVVVRFQPAVSYGAEEDWARRLEAEEAARYTVVLSSLSATPERETAGFLVERLQARVAGARHLDGPALLVLLDGAAFEEKLGALPEFAQRFDSRRRNWEATLGTEAAPLAVAVINRKGQDPGAAAAEAERAIWTPTPASRAVPDGR